MRFFKYLPEKVKNTAAVVASTSLATLGVFTSNMNNSSNGPLVYNPAGCWERLDENEEKNTSFKKL